MFLTLVLNQQDTRLTQWLNHLLAFSLFSDALGQHRREREKKQTTKGNKCVARSCFVPIVFSLSRFMSKC